MMLEYRSELLYPDLVVSKWILLNAFDERRGVDIVDIHLSYNLNQYILHRSL